MKKMSLKTWMAKYYPMKGKVITVKCTKCGLLGIDYEIACHELGCMSDKKEIKAKVCLWDLSSPAIIVKAKTGITYFNQVAGVGCLHMEQEGFLLPLPYIDRSYRIFNPDWWYEANNRTNLNDPPPKYVWYYADKKNRDLMTKKSMALWNMEHGLPGEEIYHEIERTINNKSFILNNIDKLHVVRDVPQMEAWIQVTFKLTTDSKVFEGVLTWENCD